MGKKLKLHTIFATHKPQLHSTKASSKQFIGFHEFFISSHSVDFIQKKKEITQKMLGIELS
jgi:hypothetical protein